MSGDESHTADTKKRERKKMESIEVDDEMQEVDMNEHSVWADAQKSGPEYVRPNISDSIDEDVEPVLEEADEKDQAFQTTVKKEEGSASGNEKIACGETENKQDK
ncbi:DgyrCDS12349 [Dimorphilus gyrociliatus]|uniref:DgyrCDS12349 n=1 Tax=Dimorphilus gyrociliatus TaxID=2664684 RepID=A0A7I8W833_9ANNE|nr:DgyrCDS12349 [Dimorphilus gyrociliatus]